MSKKTLLLTLFLFITAAFSPVAAQGNSGADTVYTFRFLPQKDMFYVPMYDNENELARLLDCIDRLMPGITDGTVPVYVDGYCSSMGSEKENLATAAIRSNRVKSELIIRRNLTEDCFVTANHPTDGDYVVVRVKAPTNLPHRGEAKDGKASDNMNGTVFGNMDSKASNNMDSKASDNSPAESEGLSLPHRGRLEGLRLPLQPAALGHAYARPRHRVAHQPVVGLTGQRLMDIMELERQRPPLRSVGGYARGALLYRQQQGMVSGRYVQDGRVQL